MDLTAQQALSKRLFNSQHRLDAISALHERGIEVGDFSHEDFVGFSGLPRTAAHKELKILVEFEALTTSSAYGRVFYSVQAGPFWEWAGQLLGARVVEQVHDDEHAEDQSDAP